MRNRNCNNMGWNTSRRIWAGLFFLAIGGVLLARQFGFDFPGWLFTWQMLLIVIGLFIGAQQNFRDFGWLIMVSIGVIFLLDDIWPELPVKNFAWPIGIIAVGLIVIFGAFRRSRKENFELNDVSTSNTIISASGASNEDIIDAVAIFGSVKKMIYSKKFRGGEIVTVFGGSEINLSQADFEGTLVIEIVQIFGGTKLIIPPHWEVRSQAVAILGGIEDKRQQHQGPDAKKILVLDGVAILGGIEIKSY